jgi:hypothetical protein
LCPHGACLSRRTGRCCSEAPLRKGARRATDLVTTPDRAPRNGLAASFESRSW